MKLGSVIIRPVLPDELESVAALRAVGFGGAKQEALKSLVNNPRYEPSNLLVADYEGTLIGTGAVFPAKMWLSGVPLDLAAVAGITVLPEYRGNGVAAKIVEFLIVRMYAEQRALSLLFPFSHKYYNGFGYGTVSDLHAYRFRPGNIIAFDGVENVRPFAPDDLHILRVLYKGELTWHNGWFTRSDEWWDKVINQWSNIVVYDDGMVAGYLAYSINTNQLGERVLRINEFFATEDEAYRGLFAYLAAHDDVDSINYLAPAHTPLRHCLRQPIAVNARNHGWVFNDLCYVTAGPMARIINLQKALTTRFYTRGMSGEKVLKVTDPLIPSNEEPISFRLVDGRAETHPASDSTPHIETDIRTLTQILCGYLKASDARRVGWFNANEDTCSWLDKIIVDAPLYVQAGDWF